MIITLTHSNNKAPRHDAQGAFVSILNGAISRRLDAAPIAYLALTVLTFYLVGVVVGVGEPVGVGAPV